MKNSKKIASVLMATALLAAAGISASAEETTTITELGGTSSADVTGTYSNTVTTPTVYNVEIEWEKLEFSFSKTGTMDWNTDSHTYEDHTESAWTSDSNGVSVTNHSNAAVKVNLDFAAAEGIGNVTGNFGDDNEFTLNQPEEGEFTGLDTYKNCALTLSGEPNQFEDGSTIGTVTVTLSAAE